MFLRLTLIITISLSLGINAYANVSYNQFSPSKFSKNNEVVAEIWNSNKGLWRLKNSKYKKDFYKLANFFQPQINPLYCGMASSVIILNALRSDNNKRISQKELEVIRPAIFGGGSIPFKSYSQLTFLNEETNKIKKREVIEMKNIEAKKSELDPGVTLEQLSQILETYDLETEVNHVKKVDNKTLHQFRNTLKKILNDQERYILANFRGKSAGLKTSGHISPLVAYDQEGDTILVMDVAGHKNPWYWIKLEHLFKAMNTKDGDNYRGYMIISD